MCFRVLIASLALLLGCSDFDCPDGQSRIEGRCTSANQGSENPDPKTKLVGLGCSNNLPFSGGVSLIRWELTVDPESIRSGERFLASVQATAFFPELLLNAAQHTSAGGVSRVNVHRLQATLHVRTGVTDTAEESDVTLTFADAVTPTPWTCRYDGNGNADVAGREYPSCSPENDNPDDDSNADCTGLGGVPNPDNPCGQFVPIPTSDDCDVCESLGKPFELTYSPFELCERHGFCVTAPLAVDLAGDVLEYHAASSGRVLFGWDDLSTGAEIDQTSGPNDGTWQLPLADFEAEPGPNAMRVTMGGTDVALECTMAVSSFSVFGVASRNNLTSPAPDHVLISFPIQEP